MLHRAVIVEMIAGEVGEHHALERQSVEPPLIQAVGGGFHGDRAGTTISQRRERGLEVHRPRRRERARRRRHPLPRPVERPQRPDAGGVVLPVEQVAHDAGRGGLAVGAGDAHHRERGGGIAIPGPRQGNRGPAAVGHDQLRRPGLERPFHHDRSRPAGYRVGHEAMPVHLRAPHRDEERARHHAPAVGGERAERRQARPARTGADPPSGAPRSAGAASVTATCPASRPARPSSPRPASRPPAGMLRVTTPAPSTRTRSPR